MTDGYLSNESVAIVTTLSSGPSLRYLAILIAPKMLQIPETPKSAVVEAPLVGIEASLAVVGAAGNEKRHANAFAIRDVAVSYRRVVHDKPPYAMLSKRPLLWMRWIVSAANRA